MQKIVILGGGISAEREISLLTSQTIKSALESDEMSVEILDPADYTDWTSMISHLMSVQPEMIFMGLHGAAGEDGSLQKLLETHNLPFTGSGSEACKLAMDKKAALDLATHLNIPVAAHVYLHKAEIFTEEEIINTTELPLVVKPNSSGSSVGINIVEKKEDLGAALINAWQYEDNLLCEKFIPGRELTVTILADKALPVVEIKPLNGWYDYANKYTHGNTEYICPAELTEMEQSTVQNHALEIFHKMGCAVYSRIDFRYDGEKFYFLEVNTLPGMTALSLTPMAAKAIGLDLRALLSEIINLSKQK
ncbi:MAG: D-alanine--D-alanine ligase [Candidatus Cloacimonetes bacterium]|nr:D-alanine--D-alanine ligase [Candidatus Cloacimonadota bacterium]